MPQYKSQLGHLLALLAQLEEGGLARVLTEQVGDVAQGAAVVLRDILEPGLLDVGGSRDSHAGGGIVVRVGQSVVVLLLGREGNLLSLVLVAGLRMHPGLLGVGIVPVMSVEIGIG